MTNFAKPVMQYTVRKKEAFIVEVSVQCMGSMRRRATTIPTSTITLSPTLTLWAMEERSRRPYSLQLPMVRHCHHSRALTFFGLSFEISAMHLVSSDIYASDEFLQASGASRSFPCSNAGHLAPSYNIGAAAEPISKQWQSVAVLFQPHLG